MQLLKKVHPGWFIPLLLLGGCQDKEEAIPSYIKIEPFAVDAPGGAGWQKITEAWVYLNAEFIGGYPLPAVVPVLAEGENTLQIFPGVRANGQTLSPNVYPFLDYYEKTVTLDPGQTTVIQPNTRYASGAIFPWSVERSTFDNSVLVLENRDTDTSNTFVISADGAFEGRSVKLEVDTAHQVLEISTEQVENLPNTGDRQVWLEMHYRNDIPFELWLLGSGGQGTNGEKAQPVFQFVPSENWNKIYFNLTQFLVNLQEKKHSLFFRVKLPTDTKGSPTQNNGAVFLDNIRLVHF